MIKYDIFNQKIMLKTELCFKTFFRKRPAVATLQRRNVRSFVEIAESSCDNNCWIQATNKFDTNEILSKVFNQK